MYRIQAAGKPEVVPPERTHLRATLSSPLRLLYYPPRRLGSEATIAAT